MSDLEDLTRGLGELLVAHQRHKGGCLCGAVGLGQSHPDHVAEVIAAHLTTKTPPTPAGARAYFGTKDERVVFAVCTKEQWDRRIETEGTLTGTSVIWPDPPQGILMTPAVFDRWLMGQVVPWWEKLKAEWPPAQALSGREAG